MVRGLFVCLVAFLATIGSQTGAELPDRAREYIVFGHFDEAIRVADDFLTRYPSSPLAADARYVRNQARLFKTLSEAADDPPLRSAAPLIQSLRRLTSEPLDDAVAAAKLALGTVHYLATDESKPERLVTEALRDWQQLDAARSPRPAKPAFVQDVIEIRNVVFQQTRRLLTRTSHVFVRPDTLVRFDPEGPSERVVTYVPLPGHANVIFLGDERRLMLDRILTTVGTARKRSWMRKGPRRDVLTFWSKASFGVVGRWGGWSIGPHLHIASIEFLPAAGTVAKVRVVTGESDGTVWLEKRDGVWTATGQAFPGGRPVSTSISSTSLRMRATWRVMTSDSASASAPQRRLRISAAASTDISAFRSSCPS